VRNYKKGQEVEAIVLAVDVERERISLGIKQLDGDPFTSYTTLNDRGALVTGKVKTVDPRGAEIQLNDDVTGYLRASEISRDRVEDARNVLKEGDEVSVMIINIDRKTRNDPAVDQGQGQCRPAGSHAAPVARQRARKRRHDQPGRPAARQAGQQGQRLRLTVRLHDALRPRCGAGRAFGQLTQRDTEFAVKTILDAMSDALGARASHRDPRLRQLLDQPSPAKRWAATRAAASR
jgi:predicted RNA-binding protein with RPS1 domain